MAHKTTTRRSTYQSLCLIHKTLKTSLLKSASLMMTMKVLNPTSLLVPLPEANSRPWLNRQQHPCYSRANT